MVLQLDKATSYDSNLGNAELAEAQEGREAYAVIKATDVIVGLD
jgi:molybdopterin-binding protein